MARQGKGHCNPTEVYGAIQKHSGEEEPRFIHWCSRKVHSASPSKESGYSNIVYLASKTEAFQI